MDKSVNNIKIYCDGACQGNQYAENIGGWGFVALLCSDDIIRNEVYHSGGIIKTTNNRMEMISVYESLKWCRGYIRQYKPIKITVFSDSRYIVDCFNCRWYDAWLKNGWKNSQKNQVANIDLWKLLLKMYQEVPAKFTWVRGHNGNHYQEEADLLAVNKIEEMREKIGLSNKEYQTGQEYYNFEKTMEEPE